MATNAIDLPLSFIENFQTELDRLGCPATVRPPSACFPADLIELWDGEGDFLTLLPITLSPEAAVLAYGLYQLGVRHGCRAGEESAWARLRRLIGASPRDVPHT